MSRDQLRVMNAMERCRTACAAASNSTINVNCNALPITAAATGIAPKCQSPARAQWIEERQAELVDTLYFHVVFTVREEIAAIAYQNREVMYNILFRATSETLRTIAADPEHLGAEIAFFPVLHTWGQNLTFHPNLHCVAPGGGICPDGKRWIPCRPHFFLPDAGSLPFPPLVSGMAGEGV